MTDLKKELAALKIDRSRPARRRWYRSKLLFIVVTLAAGGLYALRSNPAFSAPEVQTVTASVSRALEPPAGSPILTAAGYVVARRKAVVSSKIQGLLADLRVEEGSQVKQGEVIARLESADYEAQVERADAAVRRAEADLAEVQRQLRTAERLATERVLSQDQRDAAASRVKIAEAAVAQAVAELSFSRAQLQNTLIRAPFAGVVVRKMAEVGESVAPIPPGVNISTSSGAIVALADLATLEVEADVAESNVAKIRAGQPAEVTVEAFPDRRYEAVLRQIIPTADRTKATVQVKVTIIDKDRDLKPEMSAKVTFLELAKKGEDEAAATAPVVMVPTEAVVSRDGKSVVFLVREGKVRARSIVTGLERQGKLVVLQGLAGGEALVAVPRESLRDGDAVRVRG